MSLAGDPFDGPALDRGDSEPALVVDVDGFEGPLDLLLELARRQKVDLHRISIAALAEQYVGFIEEARRLRLELAADYLVMAAWLAYLKSRLLLPVAPRPGEPEPVDLADALKRRLAHLQAVRLVANGLSERDQLGRDVFGRGMAQAAAPRASVDFTVSLYELLDAYAAQRQHIALSNVRIARREVWSLVDARMALERMFGDLSGHWTELDVLITRFLPAGHARATVAASSFSAALELVKEGRLDLRQDKAFGPILLRPRLAESQA